MELQGFKLQSVEARCDFPESPLFWNGASSAVNSHLKNYTDWGRDSNGFLLGSSHERVYIYRDSICSSIEALPIEVKEISKKVTNFSTNTLKVMKYVLRHYGYSSVIEANYSYRFFKQVDPKSYRLSDMVSELLKIPHHFNKEFQADVVDFGWNVTFPIENLWCYTHIFGLHKRDITTTFPMSADKCGDMGILIKVSFESPKNQDTFSLRQVEKLFKIHPEKFLSITKSIIESFSTP